MNDQNNKTKEDMLTDKELEKVSGGTSSQIPGRTCPHCGKFIPTSILELVTQGHLRCPYCLSILNIDPQNA